MTHPTKTTAGRFDPTAQIIRASLKRWTLQVRANLDLTRTARLDLITAALSLEFQPAQA